ncbi:MAG: FHA domain-containing protein [Ruminococcaceae bacterium]|nr:FHA domain-containing protein [Oscillospiraceae bacterium]
MEIFEEYSRLIFAVLSLVIIIGCTFSLFSKRPKSKTVAFLVNEKSGEAVPLYYWETSIGRSPDCDIVLKYPTVSRFHGVVSRRKNTWIIFDTDSKTGVGLNGQKIRKKANLTDGDKLTFGEVTYIFSAPDFGDKKKTAQQKKIQKYALVSMATGKTLNLNGTIITIGRDRNCDIFLNLQTVSRKHVEMHYINSGWRIKNFSPNGVYVNNRLYTTEKILKAGDIIDIGGAKIQFVEVK